jgi:ABC-type sugar transport system ATPase subunit
MIRLQGLRVQAGEFSLTIADLSVEPGEYLMVLGPTASGKTVLLETVAGLRRPRDGRVWFGDRDVTTEPPEKRGAGLVYQDYALFPHLTVAQNISFGLRPQESCARGSAVPGGVLSGALGGGSTTDGAGWGGIRRRRSADERARVRELAALVGIDGLLARYPEGLSGGERQRVALARALAIEPEVLLLDEPLSALDGPTRVELQGELKRLQRELGATVMHVTHDLNEALALGDRMAVLVGGELRQVGVPQQVTCFPADAEVARLAGLPNVFPIAETGGEAAGAPGEAASPEGERNRIRLETGHWLVVEGALPARSGGRLLAVIRAEEIELSLDHSRETLASSGCDETTEHDNLLRGVIKGVKVQSVHASIEVEILPARIEGPGWSLVIHILRPQIEKLGIIAGAPVRVQIPAAAIHICADAASLGGG